MCKNSKKLLLITGLMLVCLSLPSLQLQSATLYTTVPESEQTIVMSMSQWNELKQELIEQENDLNQLKLKLKMLRSTSSEQMQLLENLQSELNATRQSLMNANVSLTECRNELEKSKASLETLKAQIKAMEHKQVVLRRQRDVWAAIAALSLGGVIVRR